MKLDVGMRDTVVEAYTERYGSAPALIARAPGRVNLIGDHTDYNNGFVLPMAIDRAVWIAFTPRTDRRVSVYSLDFLESFAFDINDVTPVPAPANIDFQAGWGEYVRGVAWAMARGGYDVHGWEGVVAGDVPLGAGLSSSAALEVASARALVDANDRWDATQVAKLAQRAENRWIGVNCGIMDQLISATGAEDNAVLIDCKTLDTRLVPVPTNAAVVVLDTATRRELTESAYNDRRRACDKAAEKFGVPTLREVTLEQFNAQSSMLDPVTLRRARHVLNENRRTLAAADALASGDLMCAGQYMNESHASLRDDFEVSRVELDIMVGLAQGHEACFGARMTGAGFGGCAVALVDREAAETFSADVAKAYAEKTGLTPAVYVSTAAAGAGLETV